MTDNSTIILKNVTITYPNGVEGIKNISFALPKNTVTSIIGASGSGKTTLLRSFNLLHELYPNIKKEGEINWNGKNQLEMNILDLRKKVGMIFQDPISFPHVNIFDNVIFGYALNGIKLTKQQKQEVVEKNLVEVGLWDEVCDMLNKKPTILTRNQQQRLGIARTLAMNPEIILMDNPVNLMDNQGVVVIEDLIHRLKLNHTILLIPKNINEAARVSDYMVYLEKGELIEFRPTNDMLVNPKDPRTELFIIRNNQ
ncbi:ATP-binding cassette domain-containing protein [Bacteroidales bacterium OttesenSCG-928-M11]|nr:ATP-binding cassette domain-containing protein [Bacteroidales bacterium OttesenSCG-928-M11]